jgi:hypothetical protein
MVKIKYRIIFLILLSFLLINCSTYKNILEKETEKIVIKIFGWEKDNINEDYLIIEILNNDDINKLINYSTKKILPTYKCGYQGKVEYFCKDNNLIMDMNFNIDCKIFVFIYNNKLFTREISKDGIEYFRNLINIIPEENRL